MRIGPFEDRDYFAKLVFEFPRDYPKVLPKINIVEIQPPAPEIRQQVQHIIDTHPKQHQGSESVYEVNAAIMDFLDQTSVAKAANKAEYSLEEERTARAALTKKQLEEQNEWARKQNAEDAEKRELLLVSQVETEKQRLQKTTLSRKVTGEESADLYDVPEDPVRFDQSMTSRDIVTSVPFKFKAVVGRSVILKRKDKKVTIVSPRVDTERVQAPQLLLKVIYLPETIAPKADLQKCMEKVEEDLESSKEHRHQNVVDLINYKIEHVTLADGTGEWKLAILSEFANRGSLADLLHIFGALSAAKIRSWARQLADALLFFDQQGYVHPAVRAENVMLFLGTNGAITIKLSDGYGTELRDLVLAARDPSAVANKDLPLWTAPELNWKPPKRTSKTCIWDLGVIIMQMAIGKDVKEMYTSPTNVLDGCDFESSSERLMEEMFQPNPSSRPTAFELTRKEFFYEEREAMFRNHSPNLPSTPNRRRRYSDKLGNSRYHNEWEEFEKIGKGGFGKVVRARLKLDGQFYAVKQIDSSSTKMLEDILGEVSLLARLSHPYIVRYYTAWYETERSERVDDRQLRKVLKRSVQQGPALSTGHDFMEPSVYRNQGPEYSSDDGDMFAYQPPPSIDEQDGYDEDPFGSDPEPEVNQEEDISNPFASPSPPEPIPANENPFAASSDTPSASAPALRPHVPQGPNEKSILYIQMELCAGQNLRNRISQGLSKDVDAVWRLFRRIVEGLVHVHESGVVHRDLKPENIFLDAHDTPKIGDFGLATAGQATSKAHVSKPGMTITKSTGLGTYGYTAPELYTRGSKYDARADMYSLGIMFFEMCYPFKTVQEKATLMNELAKKPPVLPEYFNDPIHQRQGEIIVQLVNRDQEQRPNARALLDSGKIPEPLEDEKFQRYIERMTEENPEEYHAVVTKFFSKTNSTIASLAWEDRSAKGMSSVDSMLWISTCDQIKSIFRRHGATEDVRQGIIPKSDFSSKNAATYLDTSGLVVQLPEDLTVSLARTLGQTSCHLSKTYCFGTVYRATVPGNQPRQVPEVDFDLVSHSARDLSIKEAEVVKVLDEILLEFPALACRNWTIYLNHADLVDIILDFCRVKPSEVSNVKQALSHLNIGSNTWTQVREQLRGSAMNIAETSVTDLSRFNFDGDVEKIRTKLAKLFGDSDHLTKALPLMSRLNEVMQFLKHMNVRTKVVVAPLSINSEHLYRGSLLLQCTETHSRKVLAVGGRYDALIQEYQTKSDKGSTRSVGFRLNISDLIAYVRGQGQGHPGSKAGKGDPRVQTRCDILVTSFDASTLRTSGVEILASLWAAGFRAELSEEFRSLEELEMAYKDNANYWLVIVRGGAGERGLKVRSPSRSEDEVKVGDLVAFLRLQMAKNR